MIYPNKTSMHSIIENILNVNNKIENILNFYERCDNLTLYDRIKEIAKNKNMTISVIEENSGISNGSISKWKKNMPKADNLYRVASFLGVSIEYLLGGTDEIKTKKEDIVNEEKFEDYKSLLSENELEIIEILRKFTDSRNQIKFIARVEALAIDMLNNLTQDNK